MTALERVLAEEWPDGRFGRPRPAAPDLTCTPAIRQPTRKASS